RAVTVPGSDDGTRPRAEPAAAGDRDLDDVPLPVLRLSPEPPASPDNRMWLIVMGGVAALVVVLIVGFSLRPSTEQTRDDLLADRLEAILRPPEGDPASSLDRAERAGIVNDKVVTREKLLALSRLPELESLTLLHCRADAPATWEGLAALKS